MKYAKPPLTITSEQRALNIHQPVHVLGVCTGLGHFPSGRCAIGTKRRVDRYLVRRVHKTTILGHVIPTYPRRGHVPGAGINRSLRRMHALPEQLQAELERGNVAIEESKVGLIDAVQIHTTGKNSV